MHTVYKSAFTKVEECYLSLEPAKFTNILQCSLTFMTQEVFRHEISLLFASKPKMSAVLPYYTD